MHRSNMQRRHYRAVEDLLADLLLMYDNCEFYNESGSLFGREARRQRRALIANLKQLGIAVPAIHSRHE